MPCICYINKRFNNNSKQIIYTAIDIINEYANQGFDLTLRQLYYQFVSRGFIENKEAEYKRLGNLINDARLAGMIDWNCIVDRTRKIKSNSHWSQPSEIVTDCINAYKIDKWEGQRYRPEVWIEKDALIGVIENICIQNDVSYFSCRGYVSQSSMWRASERLIDYSQQEQIPVIIHLGDHDPSGIDMTRDIYDRLFLFMQDCTSGLYNLEVNRIALNMKQIKQFNPPPNPAKITDTRVKDYIKKYGNESWELDALEPTLIRSLIEEAILDLRNHDLWVKKSKQELKDKSILKKIANNLRRPDDAKV